MNEKTCPLCYGTGQWESECCDGSGGCSCRGQIVPMGRCNGCHGSGVVGDDLDAMANVKAIRGACFLGTGPQDGYWADAPRLGMRW